MPTVKSVVVIPARLDSSRLPQKVMADIWGKPMLWHVYHQCIKAVKPEAVHIATDSEEVARAVQSWGGQVWMTDPDCVSGTERIVSILDRLEGDFIVNVQGDQPLIAPELIDRAIAVFENTDPKPDIITPVCPIVDAKIFDPNVVKVVLRHDGYALYFSRSPVPYVRDREPAQWLQSTQFWGHVGIYGYRREVLQNYTALPMSFLEQAEKLEQLRFLEAGKSIFTFATEHQHISVDTAKDLETVRQLLAHIS